MSGKFRDRIGMLLIVGVLAGVGIAADEKEENDNEEKKYPFAVKFIDEDGKPIEGATAGVTAYFGYKEGTLTTADETGWQYWLGATSNAEGMANFPDGQKETDHLCVVARHTARKLVGLWKIDSEKLDPKKTSGIVEITMHPACRVSGRLACRDLTELNREIGWSNVHLVSEGNRAFGCSSTDQTFHFYVPPGEYVLNAYGAKLHSVNKEFSIKPGQRELEIEPVELPATRLALLEGKPAPELKDIECWKNGPAVNLADLKGKCVILDFWGYWCGPCVYRMPELFKLHDKYHDNGLEIIGIHIDLGEDEKDPVDTVEKLDGRLTKIRQDIWQGRDVPYPVALVSGKPASFGTAIETRKARSTISAQYGVTSYPTLILIDRKGNVVGSFYPHVADHIARLESLLKDQ